MSNMSYCRFRNTLGDLQDCIESMDEPCSRDEHDARKALIEEMVNFCIDGIGLEIEDDDMVDSFADDLPRD